jgi:Uma2 family endonuclease
MSSSVSVTMPPGLIRLTLDEYMELPNDGKRYEIIDGELYVTPAPIPKHQKVSRKLQVILFLALEKTGQGEVYNAPIDLILDHHTVVQPDLLFIRSENLHIIGPKNIQGVPNLVVEILSPSTRRTDVLTKGGVYARFGVPFYWIVDPDLDRIEFFRLEDRAYQLQFLRSCPEVATPAEFPGLQISLAEVFG